VGGVIFFLFVYLPGGTMLSLEELRSYAMGKHGDQKYGEYDYVYHLDDTFAISLEFHLPRVVQRAMYGHDLREDTDVSENEIIEKFGAREGFIIETLSGFGENRVEKQQMIVAKLILADDRDCDNAKMCDRLGNMRHTYANESWSKFNMFCKEEELYHPIFSRGDPRLYEAIQRLYRLPKRK
jgi:guanosine-3',5'-bis(diphosphate) 3'-pyrophosphohydrolase